MRSSLGQCNDCAALALEENHSSATPTDPTQAAAEHTSRLIEFPGVSRSTVPQWRKDLSERVRAAQERRAREEGIEANLQETAGEASAVDLAPQLELLQQTESAPVNPLVAAALRRIERAHESHEYMDRSRNAVSAAAVAYAAPMEFECETHSQTAAQVGAPSVSVTLEDTETKQPERVHNLVVVPPTIPKAETQAAPKPKPRRMIGDINDPALNYLDSIPTAAGVETAGRRRASIFARVTSAVLDLIVVSLLCVPFAAALELTNVNWLDPRVWIVSAGVFSLFGFLYFTISTALTGRTLGLQLLSLRVVDARTGLIPTGTQSAGRALIYLASLFILGITSIFALFNSERLTAHDRITRTAVVHG
jgi:uncharacterized RDD family membrane protein YckC